MAQRALVLGQLEEEQGQEWFEKTVWSLHEEKRQKKEMKDVDQVAFSREKFVEDVKVRVASYQSADES